MTTYAFITRLEQTAMEAQKAEIAFRRNIAAETDRLERARQHAFRRVDLARRMSAAAASSQTREVAMAAQIAALRTELGWYGESPERARICEAWQAVAEAVWREVGCACRDETGEALSVADALRAFEAWYEIEFRSPFLELLDQEVPELPVVEF